MESKPKDQKSNAQPNKEEEKQKTRNRFERLRQIEVEIQAKWAAEKTFDMEAKKGYESMPFEEKNKTKFMTTFPYPYQNGYAHLGHAFSLSKCEFQARYQRQLGKNSLFPFSFHCTGMPIQAAAFRLKREMDSGILKSDNNNSLTQYEILQAMGIPDEDIPKFQDPLHWLRFFPPEYKQDLQSFGLGTDWRRSFITTEVNPYYDSFVRWQFNLLKARQKIKFGKRHTVFSALENQPCADHDRSKGEQVGPQEYTLIKIKCLDLPPTLKETLSNKEVFLVAATLRPETMYGQTNCFVLPEGEYGVFRMLKDEYFICSERSAKNMAYQEMTEVFGKYEKVATVMGQELIGLPLKAPLTCYDVVYALPMPSISMGKGTGIVTSVPSDAPHDWATLRDLQTRSFLREKYGIKEEWVMPFQPVEIIEVPQYGTNCALKIMEKMGIVSQNEKDKLEQAKTEAYKIGFNDGVMILGVANGQKASEAKITTKNHLFELNQGCKYFEPESLVVSRTGEECIVALCDQWCLVYGEENWRDFCKAHVNSEIFSTYNPKTKQDFIETLDWFKEWACSRTLGLGTRVPWDHTFLIESLSDSTIYMAYYTVSHLLQGGVVDGSVPGPLGIKAEEMTDEVWSYVFLKAPYPQGCTIPEEKLQQLRYEFEYWYPMDQRCSGKDLIRNHLTMSLYNHAAIWEDHKMMPRGFFCNGHIMVDGKKMSKSEGNFLTLRNCIDMYGSDATRVALADAGDGLDDANFDQNVANSAILRLWTLEKWISDEIKKQVPQDGIDFKQHEAQDLWDKLFENEIINAIQTTTTNYTDMKFKQALKSGFFEFQGFKEDYMIAKLQKANPAVLLKFIISQLILLNPICPHFAEYCWQHHVKAVYSKCQNAPIAFKDNLLDMGWPDLSISFDPVLRRIYDYLKQVKSNVNVSLEKAKSGGKKKGKGPAQEKVVESCAVFLANDYPEWQKATIQTLQEFQFDENNKIIGNHIQAIQQKVQAPKGMGMKFAAFLLSEIEKQGKDNVLELKMPFDEAKVLEDNLAFVFENIHSIKNIKVVNVADEAFQAPADKNAREAALPGKPQPFFY